MKKEEKQPIPYTETHIITTEDLKRAYYLGYMDGIKRSLFRFTEAEDLKLTNSEWVDFLSAQFNVSRTSAKEMLHVMMSVKKEDNFKKQFSGRK